MSREGFVFCHKISLHQVENNRTQSTQEKENRKHKSNYSLPVNIVLVFLHRSISFVMIVEMAVRIQPSVLF